MTYGWGPQGPENRASEHAPTQHRQQLPGYGAPVPPQPQWPAPGQPQWSPPPPPSGQGRGPLIALIVVAMVAVLILGGVGIWALTSKKGDTPQDQASATSTTMAAESTTSAPSSSTATTSSASSSSEIPRRPQVSPARDGRAGPLSGPTFGPGETLFHFKNLKGIPFDFELLDTWECFRGSANLKADVVWQCRDVRGGTNAGGWIGVQACAASPCTDADRRSFQQKLVIDEKYWKKVDSSTDFGSLTGDLNGKRSARVGMIYVFASRGGQPDMMAYSQMTGPVEARDAMMKVVNEIRVRAAG